MYAYNRITKLTNGKDVTVPVNVSTLCELIDHRLDVDAKIQVVDQICEYLKRTQTTKNDNTVNHAETQGGT